MVADESVDNLDMLREWIEKGQIKQVVDQICPLKQTSEAYRHYENGPIKGNAKGVTAVPSFLDKPGQALKRVHIPAGMTARESWSK